MNKLSWKCRDSSVMIQGRDNMEHLGCVPHNHLHTELFTTLTKKLWDGFHHILIRYIWYGIRNNLGSLGDDIGNQHLHSLFFSYFGVGGGWWCGGGVWGVVGGVGGCGGCGGGWGGVGVGGWGRGGSGGCSRLSPPGAREFLLHLNWPWINCFMFPQIGDWWSDHWLTRN